MSSGAWRARLSSAADAERAGAGDLARALCDLPRVRGGDLLLFAGADLLALAGATPGDLERPVRGGMADPVLLWSLLEPLTRCIHESRQRVRSMPEV